MKVAEREFGQTRNNEPVQEFEIQNNNGVSCRIMNYGATLLSVKAPDRKGNAEEITLGFDNLRAYEGDHPYLGATVGRVANRIGNGRFILDGTEYQLDCGGSTHHLHGGPGAFSGSVWEASAFEKNDEAGVKFTLHSPHMDRGYPGNLAVSCTVSLSENNELCFQYEAETDSPTPVNMTNHAYWNLGGQCSGKVHDHQIRLNASHYLEVDEDLIPTGRIIPVDNSLFDLRTCSRLGDHITSAGGFDNCLVLENSDQMQKLCADVSDPESGRRMQIYTDCSTVQLYTGEYLADFETRCGTVNKQEALCLETQEHPDAVNHANFADIILRPGQKYQRRTVHQFSTT